MAYSGAEDLLLGDLELGSTNSQKFIDAAAEEMDSKLGVLYQLPLRKAGQDYTDEELPVAWKDLPTFQVLLLKHCNNKLASGRLILAISQSAEAPTVHAYGKALIDEAMNELYCLANADVDLSAARVTDAVVAPENKTPGIKQYDEESLLLGFEKSVMSGSPWTPGWYSRPGDLP